MIQGCKVNDNITSDMPNSLLDHIECRKDNSVFLCIVIMFPRNNKTNFGTLYMVSLFSKILKLFLRLLG